MGPLAPPQALGQASGSLDKGFPDFPGRPALGACRL